MSPVAVAVEFSEEELDNIIRAHAGLRVPADAESEGALAGRVHLDERKYDEYTHYLETGGLDRRGRLSGPPLDAAEVQAYRHETQRRAIVMVREADVREKRIFVARVIRFDRLMADFGRSL